MLLPYAKYQRASAMRVPLRVHPAGRAESTGTGRVRRRRRRRGRRRRRRAELPRQPLAREEAGREIPAVDDGEPEAARRHRVRLERLVGVERDLNARDARLSAQALDGLRRDRTPHPVRPEDRKSTRLNSSHLGISYAVFCLKKKKRTIKKHNINNKSIDR